MTRNIQKQTEVTFSELPCIHVEHKKQIADFETESEIYHISGYNLNECLAKLIILKKLSK